PRGLDSQAGLPHRETVVARENEVKFRAVRADPFGREAAGLTGADIPLVSVENSGPRAPRLGCIVDAEPTGEPRIAARQGLAPKRSLESGVVPDAGSIALARS